MHLPFPSRFPVILVAVVACSSPLPATDASDTINGTDGKGANMQVLSKVSIAETAASCDLNGDGKPSNVLSGAKSLIGSNLNDAVKNGTLVALLDPTSFDTAGNPWNYSVWMGGTAATGTCDPGDCAYQISEQNFSGVSCGDGKVCFSKAYFSAVVENGVMTATSPQVDMIFPYGGSVAGISMVNVTVKGPITATSGKWLGSSQLIVCGVMTAINVSFSTSSFLKPDIDTNGDGTLDGISFAFVFDTVPATMAP